MQLLQEHLVRISRRRGYPLNADFSGGRGTSAWRRGSHQPFGSEATPSFAFEVEMSYTIYQFLNSL